MWRVMRATCLVSFHRTSLLHERSRLLYDRAQSSGRLRSRPDKKTVRTKAHEGELAKRPDGHTTFVRVMAHTEYHPPARSLHMGEHRRYRAVYAIGRRFSA